MAEDKPIEEGRVVKLKGSAKLNLRAVLKSMAGPEDPIVLSCMSDTKPFLDTMATTLQNYRERAEKITVATDEDATAAGYVLQEVRNAKDSVEAQRHEFVDDLNAQVKRINARFKTLSVPLTEIETIIATKIGKYWNAKKEQAKADAAKLQKVVNRDHAKAVKAGVATGEAPQVTPPAIQKTTESFRVVERWDYEVTDLGAVPIEYLEIAAGKVRAAINAGKRDIPGLRIFQRTDVS